jgi:hypothetical protein
MKRDAELARKILGVVESAADVVDSGDIQIDGAQSDPIAYHVHLLVDSGLLTGIDVSSHDCRWAYVGLELTPEGHDFLAKQKMRRSRGAEEKMSVRPKVPEKIETDVLVQSARRCCLCHFLVGNSGVVKGQIAHLDGDPTNNAPDNLAFLCLDHHDTKDGKTSVSKNLTIAEVKTYRDRLYQQIREGLIENRGASGKSIVIQAGRGGDAIGPGSVGGTGGGISITAESGANR